MDAARPRVVEDLASHAGAKMVASLNDALALLDDPEERFALAKRCVGTLLGVCAVATLTPRARARPYGGGP
jgi:hypothetical protein